MTTDHPNGGPFTSYPQIIRWYMDSSMGYWLRINALNQESMASIHDNRSSKWWSFHFISTNNPLVYGQEI